MGFGSEAPQIFDYPPLSPFLVPVKKNPTSSLLPVSFSRTTELSYVAPEQTEIPHEFCTLSFSVKNT
uniref:Uncharacterized protein n=1 Tax=Anguilla anguilla TaxID=7936 RepID=A0A0E9UTE9_ANGAN